MSASEPHSLTAKNLKKLEKQFAEEDRRKNDLSRKRIPQRTQGDGRSSSKKSYGSQLTAFKNSLNNNNRKEVSVPRPSADNRGRKSSFYRPEREPIRRNPEGRSRNASRVQPTPIVVKIDYEEDDYRINYEEQDEEKERQLEEAPDEEESEDESSRLSSEDEMQEKKQKQPDVSSDGSPVTRSSSPDLSEEDSEDEDEEEEEEEEEEEDYSEKNSIILDPEVREAIQNLNAHTKDKTATPTSSRSLYSSSLNGSTSSIPTAASPQTRTSSRRSNRITNAPASRTSSIVSSAPSYVLNKNSYRLQKLKAKKDKDRVGATSRAESSLALSRNNSALSNLSMRERGTTTATPSRGSSVLIRNWSRWSQYSNAGYSISEASADKQRRGKPKKQDVKEMRSQKTGNSRATSRTRSALSGVLQISRIKSEPDVRKTADKRRVQLTVDPELSRSRPMSRNSRAVSRMSTRSIIKAKPTSRVKSEPNLKACVNRQNTRGNVTNRRPITKQAQNSRKSPKPISRNRARDTENGVVDEPDFSNRTKKILKKKERPSRRGAETSLSRDSIPYTVRKRNKSSLANGSERLTLNRSSMSMRSSKSGGSRGSSRSRGNLSSATTVLSRKLFPPIFKSDSGFYSDRGAVSSRGSIRAPETPFSAKGGRSTGIRSVVTHYSSGPSHPPSSARSSLFTSDGSLSSHSDGESTALGPETTTPVDKPPSKATQHTTPVPAKSEKGSESETEQLHFPPITPQSGTLTPYESPHTPTELKKTPEPREEKKRVKLPRLVRVNHPMPKLEDATRDTGIARLVKLSKPKESKAMWMTSFWPIVWGNQDMMWPISKRALSASATDRLMTLATPKKNFQLDNPAKCSRGEFSYSCGRNSVIWHVSPLAMKTDASARVTQLAQPKKPPPEFEEHRGAFQFSCGRSSPIWNVSDGAKTAEERERTLQLSQPKKPHPQYQPERHVDWPVGAGAKRAVASARVEVLARPKSRNDGPFREPMWRVSSGSRRAVASARVQELARPKQLVEGYQPCKETEWAVNRGSLRCAPSERIQILSKPIVRETMDHVQFNPDAFTVSESAKKAAISQRIVELAQPLSRGHK